MNRKDVLRIIDANLNRAQEGLRVCEEVARFVLEDKKMTEKFKKLKYKITRLIKRLPLVQLELIKSRASQADVGKELFAGATRKDFNDVFFANIQRVKESLRVLEEFSKIFNCSLAKSFSRLRYKAYSLEQETVAKLR